MKDHYDGDLEKGVVEEFQAVVDINDDAHREELWNSIPGATLRTMSDINNDGDYYDISDLQKTIDGTIAKLGINLEDLPSSVTFSKEKMCEIAVPAIFHCMETGIDEWIPDLEDTETFWDEICFYCNFTYWIYSVEYPRTGEDGQYQVIPDTILQNAAYALYKDFDGNLPAIDDDIWRAHYHDNTSTGITVGDNAPFKVIREKYQKNEDGSIDAEYETEYWGDIPAGTYRVHFEPNAHYQEADAGITYYYGVSRVERLDKPSEN